MTSRQAHSASDREQTEALDSTSASGRQSGNHRGISGNIQQSAAGRADIEQNESRHQTSDREQTETEALDSSASGRRAPPADSQAITGVVNRQQTGNIQQRAAAEQTESRQRSDMQTEVRHADRDQTSDILDMHQTDRQGDEASASGREAGNHRGER